LNDALLELVKTVSAMGANLTTMNESVRTLQVEVGDLKILAAQAQGFTKAARAMWTMVGLLLGAGGSKALEAMSVMSGGG